MPDPKHPLSELSGCCDAPLRVESADEGTSYRVCTACDRPADARAEQSASLVASVVTDELVERALSAYYMDAPIQTRSTIAFDQMRAALVAFLGSALGPGTSWTVYDAVATLKAEQSAVERLTDELNEVGADCSRLESDLLDLHDQLESAGLRGAINASSISERIGALVTAKRELRHAAMWVVLAWDTEQTQHNSMPALRRALGLPGERPYRDEAQARLDAYLKTPCALGEENCCS